MNKSKQLSDRRTDVHRSILGAVLGNVGYRQGCQGPAALAQSVWLSHMSQTAGLVGSLLHMLLHLHTCKESSCRRDDSGCEFGALVTSDKVKSAVM